GGAARWTGACCTCEWARATPLRSRVAVGFADNLRCSRAGRGQALPARARLAPLLGAPRFAARRERGRRAGGGGARSRVCEPGVRVMIPSRVPSPRAAVCSGRGPVCHAALLACPGGRAHAAPLKGGGRLRRQPPVLATRSQARAARPPPSRCAP